mgnify:CR=1 FL=1
MECEQCMDEISAYLDGELSEAKVGQIRSHVAVCAACAQELHGLEQATLFVDSRLGDLEPRPQIWQKIREEISILPAPSSPSGFLRILAANRWHTAAVTLAAIAALGAGLWSYVRHAESRHALELYMTEYVRMRDHQEQLHHQPVAGSISSDADSLSHGKYADNPFVEVSDAASVNPFQPEAR